MTQEGYHLLTVLRSGGEYGVDHVDMLAGQVRKHHSIKQSVGMVCISDILPGMVEVRKNVILWARPEGEHWPGWWMKMAMFHPDLPFDDVLYCDLDTVIVDEIYDLLDAEGSIVLRDFYRGGDGIGSGLMRWTKKDRAVIWNHWIKDPAGHMERYHRGGDQIFLESVAQYLPGLRRWQDVLPGRVISYKADMLHKGLSHPPRGTGIVCFHGVPRPWGVPDEKREWIDHANI